MSQVGYTPIVLYHSITATNVPLAANLAAGELAINTADGKLYYKDSGGTVQVLAGKGGSGVVGGSNTQVQFNNSGVFGGSANLTFNGTTLTAAAFSGPLTGSVTGNVTGNVSGTALNVTGVVAIANGGTGQSTQANALTAITGTQTSGYYVRSNGTSSSLSALQAADMTGAVAIANGGTGATSANAALTALGAQATLVSGTNIKTINSTSLLGAGNLSVVTAPAGSNTEIQFNNFGSFGSSSGLSWLAGTNTLNVTAISVTNNSTIGGILIGKGYAYVADSTAIGYGALSSTSNSGNGVTAIGYQSLTSNTTGSYSVAVGANSLTTNTTGNYNVGVGYQALKTNLGGGSNSAVGYNSMYTNGSGSYNSALGTSSLYSNTTGQYNAAVGLQAMYSNTTGIYNIGVGVYALSSNTTGLDNVAIGREALYSGVTSNYGTAVGSRSQYYVNNTTFGFNNTNVSVGYESLRGSTTAASNTGANNVAIGYQPMIGNTSGTDNVSIGYQSMNLNSTGSNNIAIGSLSLNQNFTGSQNVAIGQGAITNGTGSTNVAIGYNSFVGTSGVSPGANNTAVGPYTMYTNRGGSKGTAIGAESQYYAYIQNTVFDNTNVSVGYQSLRGSTTPGNNTGSGNTAIGWQSYLNNSSGIYGVAVGYQALTANTTGSGNTGVGYRALSATTTGGGNTSINPINAAGQYLPVFNPTTEDNRFCMGSTSVTNAYIQVAWTVVSDARDKTDFAEVPHGLDFVAGLNPVAYRYKETRDATEGHGPVRYGFKAQEVLALEKSFGTTPVVIDDEDSEKLRMVDSSLIPILVNAIKELKAEFDAYKASHP